MEYVLLVMLGLCCAVLVACGVGLALSDAQLDALSDWMEVRW